MAKVAQLRGAKFSKGRRVAEIEDTTGMMSAYDDVLTWLGFTEIGDYKQRTVAYCCTLAKERRAIFKRAAAPSTVGRAP